MNTPLSWSVACWNVQNPSLFRATRQADYLGLQGFDAIVLTETKLSPGCTLLADSLRSSGYHVFEQDQSEDGYGVLIACRSKLSPVDTEKPHPTLSGRFRTLRIPLFGDPIYLAGVYVPSRDASQERIGRKRKFTFEMIQALSAHQIDLPIILCGDLNVLERSHVPRYAAFRNWEYCVHESLAELGLGDAFRAFEPTTQAHSWVGRTGNGYRYDHIFASESLAPLLSGCWYNHEPRTNGLSDHSLMVACLRASPTAD